MADELPPCPFCGGDAWSEREFWQGAAPAGSLFSDDVGCPNCGVWLPLDAWNRRDGCEVCMFGAKPMTEENMRELGWVRERTCRHKHVLRACNVPYECSECGYAAYIPWPRYCPGCGARVVYLDE